MRNRKLPLAVLAAGVLAMFMSAAPAQEITPQHVTTEGTQAAYPADKNDDLRGLTKRELFALELAKFNLQRACVDPSTCNTSTGADFAVRYADALIYRLNQ